MNPFVLLVLAIACEVMGTANLRASEGFTRPWPIVLIVVGYVCSFYLLSRVLQHIPLGTAYAIWSGLGTAGTVAVGVAIWHERLNPARVAGIALIIIGVVVLHVLGGSEGGHAGAPGG